MKLRSRALPVIASVALVAAACAGDEGDDGNDPVEDVEQDDDGTEEAEGVTDDDATGEDDTDDAATGGEAGDPESEDGDPGSEAGDPGSEEGDAAAAAAATTDGFEVAESDLGEHLVTAEGAAVYAAVDQQDGEVVCTGSCAQVWPAVTVEGEPEAGDGVDEALLGTVELEDGSLQVVYDDAPLHTFVSDRETGDVAGHGSADRWWVVGPDGELIDAPDPDEED